MQSKNKINAISVYIYKCNYVSIINYVYIMIMSYILITSLKKLKIIKCLTFIVVTFYPTRFLSMKCMYTNDSK